MVERPVHADWSFTDRTPDRVPSVPLGLSPGRHWCHDVPKRRGGTTGVGSSPSGPGPKTPVTHREAETSSRTSLSRNDTVPE